jgi:diamine N-acetyltransferase
MISIEKIGEESLSIIQSLSYKVWPETYNKILTEGQVNYMLEKMYSAAALSEQILIKKHQFILAYDDRAPAGFASYGQKSMLNPLVYRLHKLYILPGLQGKGVGKKLIKFIIEDILPAGAETLELNVNRHNKAKDFYENLGFSISREEKIDIGEGYFMDDYVMETTLPGKFIL